MLRFLFVLFVLSLAIPVQAQEDSFYSMAPVQVEIRQETVREEQRNRIRFYDCYPGMLSESDEVPITMHVYINTPNGVAIYGCFISGDSFVIPVAPHTWYEKANWLLTPEQNQTIM